MILDHINSGFTGVFNNFTLCISYTTTTAIFNWTSNPAGYINTGAGPFTVTPTGTTNYLVTATAGGCTSPQATATVTVTAAPTVVITDPAPACAPATVNLTAAAITAGSTGGLTYSYYTNPGGTTVLTTPTAVATTGTFYIKGTTAGGCSSPVMPVHVTINTSVTPTFNPVAAICSGAALAALPTTSTNGITGTWAPALNNTATTTYTFTPAVGQCASTTTLTITVNPKVTPTFNPVAAICSGAALAALPTTSTNGVTGTWAPALNNTATTTYTFTPGVGQCANTTTLTITVNPSTTPTFNPVAAICSGAALAPLPTTSTNAITGTWAPALNNTATTTYTFTPGVGQCATTATLTITVNPSVTPTFNPVAAICSGAALAPLPTTSTNGITGTWAPALNNTATTTYTFTPAAGPCATTATLTITVNPTPTLVITNPAPVCAPATVNLTAAAVTAGSTGGLTYSYYTDPGGTLTFGTPAAVTTSGNYYIKGTTAAGCATPVMQVVVTVNPAPTVITAGNPQIVCLGGFVTLAGSIGGGATSSLWTAPSGAFSDATSLTSTFTPSVVGAVTLTLTTNAPAGCTAAFKTVGITANNPATANAGTTQTICAGGTVTLAGAIGGTAASSTWTAPSGTFSNAASLTSTYTPSITTGSVILTLMTNDPTGPCPAAVSTVTINVNPNVAPTFNPVAAICSGAPLAALPTTSTNGITGTWAPALNNTATTTYTFTPGVGQCAYHNNIDHHR